MHVKSETKRSRSFLLSSHPLTPLPERRGESRSNQWQFVEFVAQQLSSADEPDLILEATRELLEAILDANESMKPEDVGSALFTVTDDLASTFPAQAARQMGWSTRPDDVCA